MIATDGVFSMDGDLAPLDRICDLADRYRALVMVDDSHATGFIGKTGRGTIEHCGVMGRVDIVTSTLGKALGGAAGGFTASRPRDGRAPAAALAAVPLLEQRRARDRRREPGRARAARLDRSARAATWPRACSTTPGDFAKA